jgi:hypothetical protein
VDENRASAVGAVVILDLGEYGFPGHVVNTNAIQRVGGIDVSCDERDIHRFSMRVEAEDRQFDLRQTVFAKLHPKRLDQVETAYKSLRILLIAASARRH